MSITQKDHAQELYQILENHMQTNGEGRFCFQHCALEHIEEALEKAEKRGALTKDAPEPTIPGDKKDADN